ncbi:putative Major facilitator family transporter [Candidatus Glomeribacter gigasporarum BEG34]|uniref:Putative Major facilitator family transporter n=1 Tax=Candidatus Glomeribacter gigasporarum BEG34 TaxID=1070319 RepID=G2JB91_9BURK|nr:MFS transporter [Candidatus Glomeribacter gigasporarum]CCD30044.1 putative Major facilitator family transporter [Candidatus Glomeribacter gigasporarum BEG34]
MRNLLKIGLVANIFEWYEFAVYAYMADIIGQLFFKSETSVVGLAKAFTIFAIGYLIRPLGSLVWGTVGDRIGRGRPMKTVLMMSAIPTALIGCLPTYAQIGFLAPALLLILRLVQGFAMGAELPTNGCYIFEAAPSKYKSMLCSIVMASTKLGYLLASLVVFLLFSYFNRETVLAWAWRIPFLFSIPLIIGIRAMRRSIQDFPVQKAGTFKSAWLSLKRSMLKPVLIVSFTIALSGTLSIWTSQYLIHFLNVPRTLAWASNAVFVIASIAFKLVAGYLSHAFGYQRVIRVSVASTTLFIVPLFALFQHASFGILWVLQMLLGCLQGSITGVLMEMLARQFPQFVRCRGMNLAYTLPAAFLGGITPLVLTWMTDQTGFLLFPAFYILFFGLLALPSTIRLKAQENGKASRSAGFCARGANRA